ncbi:MAG: hypothetical protein UW52_C0035G0008, partial [Candidatus Gottesmanbacteria bacterium GW2011_GWA1_44_24b]
MAKTRTISTVEELLSEGKENGFITQDDILSLFPKPEDHI